MDAVTERQIDRVEVRETRDGLVLRFPGPDGRLEVAFAASAILITMAVAMWAFVREIAQGKREMDFNLETALGLLICSLLFVRAIGSFWSAASREEVELGPTALWVGSRIGFLRSRERYDLSDVSGLRVWRKEAPGRAGDEAPPFPDRTTLAFDHRGDIVRFGFGLEGFEPNAVVRLLAERAPSLALR